MWCFTLSRFFDNEDLLQYFILLETSFISIKSFFITNTNKYFCWYSWWWGFFSVFFRSWFYITLIRLRHPCNRHWRRITARIGGHVNWWLLLETEWSEVMLIWWLLLETGWSEVMLIWRLLLETGWSEVMLIWWLLLETEWSEVGGVNVVICLNQVQ